MLLQLQLFTTCHTEDALHGHAQLQAWNRDQEVFFF